MRKFLVLLSYFWISISVIILLILVLWYILPYRIVTFKDKVFPIVNKVVKAGTLVGYTSNYCKYLNIPATVTREFRNGLIFVTPTTINNRPTGCNKLTIYVLVPKELPAGKYIMRQTYIYKVNPIREIEIIKDTEEFTVVE